MNLAEILAALADLRRRRGDLRDAQRALIAVARAANRELNDDERGQFDERLQQIEALNGDERRLQALEADERERLAGAPPAPPTPTDPNPPAPNNDQRFSSFGEMLQCVRRAEGPGARLDPRLSTRAASGANEGTPSDGGFLVQQDFAAELLRRVYATGGLASRARHIPISSNANGIKINGINETSRANGSRWGGVQSYWVGEADTVTASRPRFRQVELNLHKLMALFYATDELLADAAALEAVAMMAFEEEFGFKLDDAIIRGNGAGQPLGFLNSPCLVTVAKEGGQAAASIVLENIVKMWARMWGPSRQNAVWLYNQDIEPVLFTLGMIVGTGGSPIFMPPGGLSSSPYGTLLGRPMIPSEQAATLGTVGDLMLVDLGQYLMADKGGMQTASSIHVRFLYDEQVFRFTLRTDGQPLWNAALTPAQGSNTLSPFVALATRS